MEKLFLIGADPFNFRICGLPNKVYQAETAEEAHAKYCRDHRPRRNWMAKVRELTEDVLRQHPWVKDIPVSP